MNKMTKMNKMNKILATLLLLMFMPLTSQVHAQDREWSFEFTIERLVGHPAAGDAPVISSETEVSKGDGENYYLGMFMEVTGESVTTLAGNRQLSDGVAGLETLALEFVFEGSGGVTQAALQTWANNLDTGFGIYIGAQPYSLSDFGLSAVDGQFLYTFAAALSTNSPATTTVGCAAGESECKVFLGSVALALDDFPDEAGGFSLRVSDVGVDAVINAVNIESAPEGVLSAVVIPVESADTISAIVCTEAGTCPLSISFGSATYSVTEGGTVDVTVELDSAATVALTVPIVVDSSSTAVQALYTGAPPTDLVFAVGDTTKTFTITAVENGDDAAIEVTTLALGFGTLDDILVPTGATVISITDNDLPAVTVTYDAAIYEVQEESTVVVMVTLSATPERAVSIGITNAAATGSTAIGGASDFTGIPASLDFAADASGAALIQTFTITRPGNDDPDSGKILDLGFTLPAGVTGGANASATVALLDNDSDGIILTVDTAMMTLDENATTTLTVTATLDLSPAVAAITADAVLTLTYGGTATDPADYTITPVSSVLTFVSGSATSLEMTTDIVITGVDDAILENAETIIIGGTITGGGVPLAAKSVTITLTDTDTATLSITPASPMVAEGEAVEFTVTIDSAIASGISVPVVVTAVTATEGDDYSFTTTSIDFPAGAANATQTFSVMSNVDTILEENETFTVAFGTPTGGGLASDVTATASATVTITDNTSLVASLAGPDSAGDGATRLYTVSLTGTSDRDIEAEITVSGIIDTEFLVGATIGLNVEQDVAEADARDNGNGTDVIFLSASHTNATATSASMLTVTVPAGDNTATFSLFIIKDDDKEPEAITVMLDTVAPVNGSGMVTVAAGVGGMQITAITSIDLPLRQRVTTATLAAIGRAISTDMIDVIESRVSATNASHLKLGNTSLSLDSVSSAFNMQDDGSYDKTQLNTLKNLLGMSTDSDGQVTFSPKSMSSLFADSSFQLSLDGEGGHSGIAGTGLSLWGRSSFSNFGSTPDGIDIDGETISGQIGTDFRSGEWITGLALNYSKGDTDYRNADDSVVGDVETEIYSLHPYMHYAPTNSKLGAWLMLGYGQGDLALTEAGDTVETDIGMQMAAAGVKYKLLETAGVDWALKADTVLVQLEIDGVEGELNADKTNNSVSRMALSASNSSDLENSARLETNVDLGIRFDEGDAESGFGGEIAGGFNYSSTALGLNLSGNGRVLVAHEAAGFEQWGASISIDFDPGTRNQGLQISLSPVWGKATSGVDSLYEGNGAINSDLTDSTLDSDSPEMALETRVAYGLPILNNNSILTPYGEMSRGDSDSSIRLGGSLEFLSSKRVSLKSDLYREQNNEGERNLVLDNRVQRKLGNGYATLSLFGRLQSESNTTNTTEGNYKFGLELSSDF